MIFLPSPDSQELFATGPTASRTRCLFSVFREPFIFTLSFLLDFCGNTTTLGCQMSDSVLSAMRIKSVFPKAPNFSQRDGREEPQSIRQVKTKEAELPY